MAESLEELTRDLNRALRERRIEDGFRLLESSSTFVERAESSEEDAASLVLCVAEWVDAGYSDHRLIESLLSRFSLDHRRRMPLSEYLLLRMAEAFSCIAKEDADRSEERRVGKEGRC